MHPFALDSVCSNLITGCSDFLEAARGFKEPILVLYGAATPRRSKAEMQALAALPNVRSVELPSGKLGVHEEFPDQVAEAVRSFLDERCVSKGTLTVLSGVFFTAWAPSRLHCKENPCQLALQSAVCGCPVHRIAQLLS